MKWFPLVSSPIVFFYKFHSTLDTELKRNERQGSELFLGKWVLMRWFPLVFLTDSVFIKLHCMLGFEGSVRCELFSTKLVCPQPSPPIPLL